jgi:GNAT superfamily N-acetyltransferase
MSLDRGTGLSCPRMQEIEADEIEQRGIDDWYGSLSGPVAAQSGAARVAVGSALVAVLARVPSAVYSRVLGLGVPSPATREQVDAALSELGQFGVGRAFVHVGPYARPPELASWLVERGLTRHPRSWMRFVRERAPVADARTDLTVRPIRDAERDQFDAVACRAFEMPETAQGLFGLLVGRPRWHALGLFDGERMAGGAALFVEGELGWLAFGGVDAAYRKRGGQSALLAERVRLALDLGCRALFTETGQAVPGDPQHSYHNILRAGFRELVVRDNYLYAPG